METILQAEWLMDLGYWGLLLGTFIAGTFVSLSSDLLIVAVLLAGGDPWLCLIAATVGCGTGVLTTYLLGWLGKWEWLERWFKVKHETLEKQRSKVTRYGVWCAFFAWLPIVGQVFMITLGFYKSRPLVTVLLAYAGCFCRFLVWVLLYRQYGQAFLDWITAHLN